MNGDAAIERCEIEGCPGARMHGGHCLEHLRTDEVHAVVERVGAGASLDARSGIISAGGLKALFDALRLGSGDRPVLHGLDFRGATFSGDADFRGVEFVGSADFKDATFTAKADFKAARFQGLARFSETTFVDAADFSEATFSGYARFRKAIFKGSAKFRAATFRGHAQFRGATFAEGAGFRMAVFERARQLGPLVVKADLVLDSAVFDERVTIEVAAGVISADAAFFAGGAHLRVRSGEVVLDDANFGGASTLSYLTRWPADDEKPETPRPPDPPGERPRLTSMRGAYVAELSLSEVDLRDCRFFAARGLESLSIDASCVWPCTPAGHRYMHRDMIADERDFRKRRDGEDDPGSESRDGLAPMQIAALYRALRKSREDDKDEAGAADLYYGEMEMRRSREAPGSDQPRDGPPRPDGLRETGLATSTRRDRVILHLYWLFSGYGLRSRRALASLALTLLVGAALLSWLGWHPRRDYGQALLFALDSSISLLRAPMPGMAADLTTVGQIVEIALRLLGPLFFGLALLGLRARVKR